MKKLAIAIGAVALCFAALAPARADFAVYKFRDNGVCRAWWNHATRPAGAYQVLWVKVPTWEVAQAKGAYAMKHHWCKAWYQ